MPWVVAPEAPERFRGRPVGALPAVQEDGPGARSAAVREGLEESWQAGGGASGPRGGAYRARASLRVPKQPGWVRGRASGQGSGKAWSGGEGPSRAGGRFPGPGEVRVGPGFRPFRRLGRTEWGNGPCGCHGRLGLFGRCGLLRGGRPGRGGRRRRGKGRVEGPGRQELAILGAQFGGLLRGRGVHLPAHGPELRVQARVEVPPLQDQVRGTVDLAGHHQEAAQLVPAPGRQDLRRSGGGLGGRWRGLPVAGEGHGQPDRGQEACPRERATRQPVHLRHAAQ